MNALISFKKKWRTIQISFCIISIFFLSMVPSFAIESKPEGITGFTYSILFPDNQIDKELGYYHLKMTPGQQQQLAIVLTNTSNEKIKVDVKVNGAKTNQNGIIEYGESDIKNDASLNSDFKDLVKAPESVELAPKETKKLELTVKMPRTSYDGVIAGGIQLMRSGQTEAKKNNNGSKIINQYAYVVGMVLQETDVAVVPDLALNSIKIGQTNYSSSIFVNFSNVKSSYLNNMTVDVKITKPGEEKVLYEHNQTDMRMAPNSFIDFPINLGGKSISSGNYEADILVTSEGKKWTWRESFKVTDEESNIVNKKNIEVVSKKGLPWKAILFLIVACLVIGLSLYFFLQFFKKNKQKKKVLQKRKNK